MMLNNIFSPHDIKPEVLSLGSHQHWLLKANVPVQKNPQLGGSCVPLCRIVI